MQPERDMYLESLIGITKKIIDSMSRAKKMTLVFTSLVLFIASLCQGADTIELSPRASDYLDGYSAYLYQGDTTGTVRVEFTVSANEKADRVGVSRLAVLAVYKEDGTFVTSVTGTVANGLLKEGYKTHMGGYTFQGYSNQVYYMVLTMYAEFGGGSGTREYTTNLCRA